MSFGAMRPACIDRHSDRHCRVRHPVYEIRTVLRHDSPSKWRRLTRVRSRHGPALARRPSRLRNPPSVTAARRPQLIRRNGGTRRAASASARGPRPCGLNPNVRWTEPAVYPARRRGISGARREKRPKLQACAEARGDVGESGLLSQVGSTSIARAGAPTGLNCM